MRPGVDADPLAWAVQGKSATHVRIFRTCPSSDNWPRLAHRCKWPSAPRTHQRAFGAKFWTLSRLTFTRGICAFIIFCFKPAFGSWTPHPPTHRTLRRHHSASWQDGMPWRRWWSVMMMMPPTPVLFQKKRPRAHINCHAMNFIFIGRPSNWASQVHIHVLPTENECWCLTVSEHLSTDGRVSTTESRYRMTDEVWELTIGFILSHQSIKWKFTLWMGHMSKKFEARASPLGPQLIKNGVTVSQSDCPLRGQFLLHISSIFTLSLLTCVQ